jgi:hypothetical protein
MFKKVSLEETDFQLELLMTEFYPNNSYKIKEINIVLMETRRFLEYVKRMIIRTI